MADDIAGCTANRRARESNVHAAPSPGDEERLAHTARRIRLERSRIGLAQIHAVRPEGGRRLTDHLGG